MGATTNFKTSVAYNVTFIHIYAMGIESRSLSNVFFGYSLVSLLFIDKMKPVQCILGKT